MMSLMNNETLRATEMQRCVVSGCVMMAGNETEAYEAAPEGSALPLAQGHLWAASWFA
jgi:hypothetical protein